MTVARRLCFFKRAREQPSQELHRDVLEREGRAMKQLEQEPVGTELDKRHDILVREGRVGSVYIGAEFGVVEGARHEGPHHAKRDFGIGQSSRTSAISPSLRRGHVSGR